MEIGSVWNGWKVESLLGEGSFGKVYKIIREELGYVYDSALKVIHIPQSPSEVASIKSQGMDDESVTMYFKSMVEELVSEFALMSKFKGTSNIVSYEDHIIEENKDSIGWTIYIRMELLTPMYNYLKDNKLSVRNVIQLGIDMCQALELCQKYNIIHRDIKPENIFVSRFGDYKLGDFGIARQLEKTTSGMSKKGTYTYMAPEVYKGMPYNSTVDIYSLGIVLYSFLNNNRTPFLPPLPQTIKFTDKEKANILRMSGKELTKPANAQGRLAEIVLKACAYEPSDRYESAVEMRRALEFVLYDESEAELIYPNGSDILNKDESGNTISKEEKPNKEVVTSSDAFEKNERTMYLFRAQAEKAAKEEAERKVREEAERKAKLEAEERAKREAVERARREAEERARREAEEKARREVEEQIRREAEAKAKREAEERARQEAVEKARREAEERAKREAEEKARKQAEERAKREAEERARKEAEAKAKKEAEQKAKAEAERKAREAAELKAKQKIEAKAKKEAEKRAKLEKEKEKTVQIKDSDKSNPETKVFIVIGLIVVAIIGIIIAVGSCNNSKITTVPNVVGMTKDKAISAIEEAGLKYKLEYGNSDTVDEELVISQSEDEGSTVDKETSITLVISEGKAIFVPNLVGKTESEVRSLLDEQGLSLEIEKEIYSDSVAKGKIISQDTESGKKVKKGDTVYVVISKGTEKVSVPNLRGVSESSAKSKLSSAKLNSKVKYEYSNSVAKGKVILQSVSSGTKVEKGTSVTITISKGKKPAPKTSSSTSNYSNNYSTPSNDYTPSNDDAPNNNSSDNGGGSNNSSNENDDDIIGMVIE